MPSHASSATRSSPLLLGRSSAAASTSKGGYLSQGRPVPPASAPSGRSSAAPDQARRRTAVCAEAVLPCLSTRDPPNFPKSAETHLWLGEALREALPGLDLDEEAMRTIIGACRAMHAVQDEVLIREGELVMEDSPGIFVLEAGELCVRKAAPHGGSSVVCICADRGDVVGELALLHNAPRAATVHVSKASLLWTVDRASFTYAKVAAAQRHREACTRRLERVPALSELGPRELAHLVDALRPARFRAGEAIIRQGEKGTDFYVLTEGEVLVKRDGAVINRHAASDHQSYFGELALINNAPRKASVVALSNVTCAKLDKASFDRLLGPLREFRAQAAAAYQAPCASRRGTRYPGSAGAAVDDHVGRYVVVASHADLKESPSCASAVVGRLSRGECFQVIEVLDEPVDGKVRARVGGDLHGWLSLAKPATGERYARRCAVEAEPLSGEESEDFDSSCAF